MVSGSAPPGDPEVRVRLSSHPSSVPAARRLVRDALAEWDLSYLADDAALCITELTSNATLHSASQYLEIVITRLPSALRLSVVDEGSVPPAAVVPRLQQEELSATGRGLVIVSALAGEWGVDETDEGKRVWASLAYENSGEDTPDESLPQHAAISAPGGLPEGWHVVRLMECPVQLSLHQDQQLDEIIRELQLVDAGVSSPTRELGDLMDKLLQGQAHARHMGRRIAQDAAAAGLDTVDVGMPVPAEAAQEVVQLHAAVMQADQLAREQQLLTLAASEEVTAVREWMVHEFVQQVENGNPPSTYRSWLRARNSADG